MQNTTNTRSDIAAVGEILKITSENDGDLFILARVYNGNLYILLRSLQTVYMNGESQRGAYVYANEYAWNKVGITLCVDDLNNLGLTDSNFKYDKSHWAIDYFKWRIIPDGGEGTTIQFGIYDKNGSSRTIVDYSQPGYPNFTNPILKFGILLRWYDFCKLVNCDHDTSEYFFQPIFTVQEGNISGAFTFINKNIPYPGNKGQTNYATYYGFFQTNSPPGITYDIDDTTKLWAGVEYDTNISATAYTDNGVQQDDTDEFHTRYFAREMYYDALSSLDNKDLEEKNKYNGLPTAWSFQSYGINSFYLYSCCGDHPCKDSCDFPTFYGYQYEGFKFMMLPVNTFNNDGKSCINQGLFDPVYHYCSTGSQIALKYNQAETSKPYYANFCAKIITGYSSSNDCVSNKSSLPYYYPRFCFSENYSKGYVINEDCGDNYMMPPKYSNEQCKSNPSSPINLIDLFGNPFGSINRDYNAIVYNSDTGDQNKCCIRNDINTDPKLVNSSSQCLGINICCKKDQDPLTCSGTNGPNGTPPCFWTDPDGNIICDTTLSKNIDCTLMCTTASQTGCEIITCDNFDTETPPAGCVNICTTDVTTNCNYQNNDGIYICDSNNYPPGCIKACKGDGSDSSNCVTVPCSDYTDNGVNPPGCLQTCTQYQNPDDDNCYYYINGTWVCNGDTPFPPGCKNLCTGDVSIDKNNCVTANCADYNYIDGCINQCSNNYPPSDCAYYDSIDNKWICNADALNLPGCINICENEKDTSNNCKRITCTNNQNNTDSPDCWEKNDGSTICTGVTNDASDCIWQTTSTTTPPNKNICKSINNPPGCVYLCDADGKPPAWSIINTPPVCVNQTCDINNNPPGCNKAYVPPDGGNNNNEDGDGGNSILMWILIIFGILVFLALIGFLVYYFFLKKKDESDFDDLLKENTEENKDNEENEENEENEDNKDTDK